ncbi:MAG: ribonuclease HII [Crenarchaeota archaeon]|nr:ribonuclease HII [Thermoproteota archaeon]MCR8454491.1 ribonuclease HII [Thermoproteota archaeon]MCR8455106.1 ribonuclease HII [Thermoproteota archaeon]MCR8462820.1 ribonuclease HII [Thermoproteota archaeon]MCR8471332.1 ribonuclease HII [Thermoproteota archaeon]
MAGSIDKLRFEVLVDNPCPKPLLAGIDEAGRGPVIGPMVIACVSVPRDKGDEVNELLLNIGVKDSKLLSKKKREELFERLKQYLGSITVAYIAPEIIDEYASKGRYNWLEAEVISRLLSLIPGIKIVYIDAPSNSKDFEKKIRSFLRGESGIELIVEKQADKKYPIVSAASIVAKVLRDKAIEEIKKEIEIDFGSGYPSDPKTREALPKILKIRPEAVRKSWKTLRKVQQTKLDDLIKHNKL